MPSRPSVLGGGCYTAAQVAERATAADRRDTVEVEGRRRRRRGPLACVAFPRIVRSPPAGARVLLSPVAPGARRPPRTLMAKLIRKSRIAVAIMNAPMVASRFQGAQ